MKLQGIKVELATADDIKNLTGKLDTMFKDGLGVYDYAVKKLKSDVNEYIKPLVGERAKLYNDLQDFKKTYKTLVGKDAGADVPFVKIAEDTIKRVDTQINDLTKKIASIS